MFSCVKKENSVSRAHAELSFNPEYIQKNKTYSGVNRIEMYCALTFPLHDTICCSIVILDCRRSKVQMHDWHCGAVSENFPVCSLC